MPTWPDDQQSDQQWTKRPCRFCSWRNFNSYTYIFEHTSVPTSNFGYFSVLILDAAQFFVSLVVIKMTCSSFGAVACCFILFVIFGHVHMQKFLVRWVCWDCTTTLNNFMRTKTTQNNFVRIQNNIPSTPFYNVRKVYGPGRLVSMRKSLEMSSNACNIRAESKMDKHLLCSE